MRINYLLILLLAAGFASNVFAEKPKDVNVVNTPNVTVTNPQTSVTVDNETGNPVPVTVQNQASSSPLQLVGFTSTTHNGGLGLFEFARLCQLEFPNSRMCTTQEAANSINIPTGLPAGNAWVRPVLQSTGGDSDRAFDLTTGLTGFANHSLNCDFWSSSSLSNPSMGTIIRNSGGFSVSPCNADLHISCCADN